MAMLERVTKTTRLHNGHTFLEHPDYFHDVGEPYVIYRDRGGWHPNEQVVRDTVITEGEGVGGFIMLLFAVLMGIILGVIMAIVSQPTDATDASTAMNNPPVTTIQQQQHPCNTAFGELFMGKQGYEVQTLQQMLNKALNRSLVTNGVFQAETEDVVRKFQSAYDLKVDGIVGEHTWKALKHAYGCTR